VFSDKKVLKELEKYRVVLICADLTKRNAKIVAEMKKFDLENVPANLIGAADPKAKVILMPEILRADDAIKLLQKAAKQRVR
jgi:thiol:disulfide interchange protein